MGEVVRQPLFVPIHDGVAVYSHLSVVLASFIEYLACDKVQQWSSGFEVSLRFRVLDTRAIQAPIAHNYRNTLLFRNQDPMKLRARIMTT
jgi:hypothetical protein